ncbi:MAG: STAS domain-containing protein [Ignavibacteria bacterium]
MENFSIDTKTIDGIVVLKLEGFLDAHTAVELEKKFDELVNNRQFKIVVDFSSLSYISSAGLGVFMAYIEIIRKNNGDIKLCEMSEKIYTIFDMLGFHILFNIHKTTSEAISKFKAQ